MIEFTDGTGWDFALSYYDVIKLNTTILDRHRQQRVSIAPGDWIRFSERRTVGYDNRVGQVMAIFPQPLFGHDRIRVQIGTTVAEIWNYDIDRKYDLDSEELLEALASN